MPRKPWKFWDPIKGETWSLPINPNDGGSPGKKKTLNYSNTAAPGGKTLVFEGRDEVETWTVSGTLIAKEQYDLFMAWFKKRHQIRVTDDLGRQYWVYITGFNPQRVRAVNAPWKHTYTLEGIVVDWPDNALTGTPEDPI